MGIRDLCSIFLVLYPVYGDIKEQKINILPAVAAVGTGLLISGDKNWDVLAAGLLPGAIMLLMGKLFNDCIGAGDCAIVLCLGVLKGFDFCMRTLAVASAGIFIFAVIGMATGRLRKTSKVAFIPFLVLGYGGAAVL